ncbi:Rieske (2Fe-2S) protein [Bounagaea algeriensis]
MSLRLARRLADSQPWLDRLADKVQPGVRERFRRIRRLHDVSDGTWLGVPLHAALTDVPLGSWTSAFVLDTYGGFRADPAVERAADAALTIGTLGALPAAVTGTGDWRDLKGQERRIATLHAFLNMVGLGCTVAALVQRARGRRRSGRVLSATGLGLSGLAAHLGGELSFGLGVRVNRSAFTARSAPADFTPVLSESELSAESMRAVDVDGFPVLLTRDRAGEPCAIANTCSHLGGPLASGERSGDVVTCPWHGSRFDVRTGGVVEGPAVFPQMTYEARVRDGTIELRRARSDVRRPTGEVATEGGRTAIQQPSFERDIRPLFRAEDVEAMSGAFDLSSYQDVRANAENIHQRLAAGDMPCDEAWSAEHVQRFRAWIEAGCPS